MRRVTITLVFFLLLVLVTAQVAPEKYFVEFTDKSNSPYSIDRPWEFLSQRALDRRAVSGIQIDISDLPVNPDYVQAVSQIGVDVITRSKWFNGITIYTTDVSKIAEIELLPFVSKVVKNVVKTRPAVGVSDKLAFEQIPVLPLNTVTDVPLKSYDSAMYGLSYTQVHMVHTDMLHNMDYRGEGKVIAVLDAGFLMVDQLAAFDSLWTHGRILGTRDFVTPGANVFQGHSHGMAVLSIMGGFVPGQLIGTAPEASFWLLRSEDAGTEYLVEEYNWVSAAEFADSAGADLINSSLGYTVFDDSTQNHTCADMTGNTTPVTRGANIAFSKGILVFNSAGNEGSNPNWQCVSAPSDGTQVLAVGAVDSLGQYASFSSKGVVNGSYVKPNVAAMGRLTVIAAADGSIIRGNGTSFSSPVMTGSAACLLQAFPEYSHVTLKMAIEESASQYENPDIYLGYGIPDLYKAFERLTGIPVIGKGKTLTAYPNPVRCSETLRLNFRSETKTECKVELINMTGQIVLSLPDISCGSGENSIPLPPQQNLRSGMYLVKLTLTRPVPEIRTVLVQIL